MYEELYSDSADDDNNDVPKWFENLPSFGTCTNLSASEIQILRLEAEKILEHQPQVDHKKSWITEIAKQGTYSDKIAALTIKIQEDPLHNINALQNLVNMVKIGKKQQCSLVIDSLTELFTRVLLKTELLNFEHQPLSELSKLDDLKQRKLLLSSWLFEEKLKNLYASYVGALSNVGLDSVAINREKSISAMYKLLINSTECEMQIVRYLVNKFGDTVHKVASKAMYTLRLVLKHRQNLNTIIFEEVRKLLFRSNIKQRAQYYGICFLTQIDVKNMAKEVIELYLAFFKACVKTGAIDSRLIGALLVGVNKSYPHVKSGIQPEQIQTMYKIVHLAPFNISLQALLLIRQLENNDRYYTALYKKISDERLISTSHQAIFIHLIYKSILDDECKERMVSFMKRIFQMCLYCPVPLVSGIFCMTSRLMKKHKGIIGKSKFEDIKTLIIPKTSTILTEKIKVDEEKYFDVVQSNLTDLTQSPQPSSWYHVKAPQITEPQVSQVLKEREIKNYYDYTARNPKFAGGEYAILAELVSLSRHYHPTVATFASRIIAGKSIYYDGNPLADFTLLHFLDRFSFKNPKKPRQDQGEENEELFRSVGTSRKHYVPKGLKGMSVVSEEYLRHEEKQIPLDEVFLYKYLKQRPKQNKKLHDNSDEDGFSDIDSVNSEDFNELLDGMMGGKKKKKYDFSRGFEKKTKSKKVKELVDESETDDDNDDFIVPQKSKNIADLAVPAEKFAAMLDAAGKNKSGGRDDILVRDNASKKQLEWEKKKGGGKRKRLEDGRKNRKRHRIQN
ncbi:Armadillo-type fold,Armadillo-like helical,CCAAT-binding factor [Cinara cedri]|uniref:Armadillo-type fold,Armadillo-like helical,CCAAT-binding factor n=1 Tax=Cinara cedri TaxID=506608 RepID=A0A5E4NFH5_9HEMI|nr:Armadillo-type fold,Armadillo-like helical,CCAAT-binding factor [Cinara cedri]